MEHWNELYWTLAERIWISHPRLSWGIIVPGNTSNVAKSRLAAINLASYIQTRVYEAVAWALLTNIMWWKWRLSTLDEDLCLWFDYVIETWGNTLNIDFTRWKNWFLKKTQKKKKWKKLGILIVEVNREMLIKDMRYMYSSNPEESFAYMIHFLIQEKWVHSIREIFPEREELILQE